MLNLRVGFLIYILLSVALVCVSAQQLVKIINYQYQGQALDDNQSKKIVGYHINYDSNNQNWAIQYIGGSLFTIQNGANGLYLGTNGESEGTAVITGVIPYKWRQLPVPGGWYQIGTTDGQYTLFLTGGNDNDPVVLKSASYRGKDSQWGYEPTQ